MLTAMLLAMQMEAIRLCDAPCRAEVLEKSQQYEQQTIENVFFDDYLHATQPWKAPVRMRNVIFQDTAVFQGFNERMDITVAQFRDEAVFDGRMLKSAGVFDATFDKELQAHVSCGESCTFSAITVTGDATFSRARGEQLDIHTALFKSDVSFRNALLQQLSIQKATFNGAADFFDAKATVRFDAVETVFEQPPRFTGANFQGIVRFDRSSFPNGLDLRPLELSGATSICLDSIQVEPKNFRFEWRQLRGKLKSWHNEKKEQFIRLTATYELLAAALDAQGNSKDADSVRYEYERVKQQYDGDLIHDLHGLFFGFGYEPWRVTFLALPLMGLFALLYWRHRNSVAEILDGDIKDGKIAHDEIGRAARVAHLLFFSTAVLLGIRFQSAWIRPKETKFLALVATEWILGIGLYILFFAAVKTSGFAYVKGLLGF